MAAVTSVVKKLNSRAHGDSDSDEAGEEANHDLGLLFVGFAFGAGEREGLGARRRWLR